MQRFSVSLDEDLAEWVDSQARQRGVSKAKVIRDAIATARQADTASAETVSLTARLADLEQRVAKLEQAQRCPSSDRSTDQSDERSSQHTYDTTGLERSQNLDESDLLAMYRSWLADRPPQSEQAKAAVLTTLRLLRNQGPMTTGELQQALYEEHEDAYASARSLWQSIKRHFDDLPGIEKAGYGKWDYTSDTDVRSKLR